jgi:predicted metal-dependent HD superfamily phosphohydrolase
VFAARHAPHAVPAATLEILARHYAEPHRAYHNASHIAEVLGWFDVVHETVGWTAPGEVYDAILFHDAIYEPLAPAGTNEARSAELALVHGASERSAQLIRMTARHGSIDPAAIARDAALFLDCDMAILGASPDAFDGYDAAIAREYAAVPAAAFRAGRGAFLAKLAAAPRIFLSDYFHTRLDGAARANLRRTAARYAGPTTAG